MFLVPFSVPRYLKYKESYFPPPVNQGNCAACWSIAIVTMMAFQLEYKTERRWGRQLLSSQSLLSCASKDVSIGCDVGGIPELAYLDDYLSKKGIPLEEAVPYEEKQTQCKLLPEDTLRVRIRPSSVTDVCLDLEGLRGKKLERTIAENVSRMKACLTNRGPFVGTIEVHENLNDFDGSRVYEGHEGTRHVGSHAIVVVGYCDSDQNPLAGFEKPYWILLNSWGPDWPLRSNRLPCGGFFAVEMGRNVCGVESRASFAEVIVPDAYSGCGFGTLSSARYESFADFYNTYPSNP